MVYKDHRTTKQQSISIKMQVFFFTSQNVTLRPDAHALQLRPRSAHGPFLLRLNIVTCILMGSCIPSLTVRSCSANGQTTVIQEWTVSGPRAGRVRVYIVKCVVLVLSWSSLRWEALHHSLSFVKNEPKK